MTSVHNLSKLWLHFYSNFIVPSQVEDILSTHDSAVVYSFLLLFPLCVKVFMLGPCFCGVALGELLSFAISLPRKRELVALL